MTPAEIEQGRRERIVSIVSRAKVAHGIESQELLADAFDAVLQRQLPSRPGTVTWHPDWLRFTPLLSAEAFLDAAAIFVPEGWGWQVANNGTAGVWSCDPVDATLSDGMIFPGVAVQASGKGATPALGLLIAALHARALLSGGGA